MENKKKTTKKVNLKKTFNRFCKIMKKLFVLIKKDLGILNEKLKNISKSKYGKISGKYLLIGGVVFVICLFMIIGNISNKDIDYPVIYNNVDSNLQLIPKKYNNEEDSIKLASSERAEDVVYANTSSRYVLFKKKNDLYIYDFKLEEETTKIVTDVVNYLFSFDDKYVITLDKERNLMVYNFKETLKIEKDVSSIIGISEDRILYEKESVLYVRSINPKKDDRLKVTEEFDTNVRFSEDGDNIVYIDNSKKLHLFNIKKDKDIEIARDVTKYYCDKESCNKMYYESRDDVKSIFYYDGKDSTRIAKEVYNVNAYDIERKQLVYTRLDNGEYSLYYQKGTNEAALVENDLQGLKEVKLYDGKDIYFTTSDGEIRYAKISGNKIRVIKSIAEDVSGYLHAYKYGYVFVSDVDNGSGTLSIVKSGKVKKIDEDIYTGFITVGKDGESIYYLKDYKTSGDLYVSKGGRGKLIEKDVRNYEYMHDDLIYFIRDYSTSKGSGDLYRYTNKSIKIAENVTRIASSPVYYIVE